VFEVRVRGKLVEITDREIGEILEGVHGIVRDSAEGMAKMARSIAPVRTGSLRSSIRFEKAESGREEIVYRVKAGGAQAPYAPFVEFGTGQRGKAGITPEGEALARAHGYRFGSKKGMAPRLFMTRSYLVWSRELENRLDQYVEEIAKKIAGR